MDSGSRLLPECLINFRNILSLSSLWQYCTYCTHKFSNFHRLYIDIRLINNCFQTKATATRIILSNYRTKDMIKSVEIKLFLWNFHTVYQIDSFYYKLKPMHENLMKYFTYDILESTVQTDISWVLEHRQNTCRKNITNSDTHTNNFSNCSCDLKNVFKENWSFLYVGLKFAINFS